MVELRSRLHFNRVMAFAKDSCSRGSFQKGRTLFHSHYGAFSQA